MKKIYIECNMGVAGDMLCGALLDTLDSDKRNETVNKLNSLFSHIDISCKSESKCEISGTKFNVQIEEEHHSHNSLSEIYGIIDSLDISDNVKENAKAVYKIIADAESKVHGMPVCDIHLHEVGAKDAIADTVSCCYLFELIGADKITVSPVTTGYGEVKCAHGILSVPAPATAEILKGIKTRRGDTESELTTPTGAALIKHFADEISEQCDMAFEAVGYGMGTKNFEKPNCVRVFISSDENEEVYELRTQVDDMTGEEIGYALNKMLSLGANDAYTTAIYMKKSRPAYMLTVICKADKKDFFTEQMFKHTSTLGIRAVKCERATLTREIIETESVKIKRSEGYGAKKAKTEFEDLTRIADEKGISIFEAKQEMCKD